MAMKEQCKNLFFTALQTNYMSIFLVLQFLPNLIFRSLEFVRANQAELNQIFPLIEILKYYLLSQLFFVTLTLIYCPKCNAEFPKTMILYFLMCKFKLFYQKVSDLASLVSQKKMQLFPLRFEFLTQVSSQYVSSSICQQETEV